MINLTQILLGISIALTLSSCATLPPSAFQSNTPLFEPEKFFAGTTRSTGVIENRGGRPHQRTTTETHGEMKDGRLYIEQDLNTENSKPRHRSWQMHRIDEHHIEATANDIVGTARGVVYGNMFTWSFTLALKRGNPLMNVRMSQTMYLQPDGKSLLIRSIIRKAGITVVQITEVFQKP